MKSYRVEGMTCQGCVKALTRAVEARLPATTVEIDLGAGTLTVDDTAEPQEIITAIEEAGFDYRGAA